MIQRIAVVLATFLIASGILVFSIFHSASVRYIFGQSPSPTPAGTVPVEIDYQLPFPGRVLPDHPLWVTKVLRDKLWLLMTTNPLKKAEISLLFANKRLAASQTLFEANKPDIAVTTLTKAEKYLEKAAFYEQKARDKNMETGDFLEKIAVASLKHQEVIQKILILAPEDAKEIINQTSIYAKDIYRDTKNTLDSMSRQYPQNPFE